ncbi:MAG: hypothetical protein UT53_C0006G0008 [Candidatus Yanofskybacteria bacterium GW2011_GWD2_39_48]|uniref:Uncharacterized protein n=1 Tax=Candidatus Yanofskybacteria bacterium GW2011_GWD2_39_48 TaxID=1619031 RepID=A0A0G0P7A1_9BACT|nr:MAG: hypothetical protein UT53_C0006G0008 [Candidatus Yanofskybacteria bacterium GW2011_GWD2_39_48]
MQKRPSKSEIILSVSLDEAFYILGVAQSDKIKMESLSSSVRQNKTIAKPLKIVSSLEAKLKEYDTANNASSL